MGRGLLLRRHLAATFPTWPEGLADVCSISNPFGLLSSIEGQIIHALLTRAPLYSRGEPLFLARLACVRPAANVRSEPGSNSPLKWIAGPATGIRRSAVRQGVEAGVPFLA